jgi:hypothetical protein
MTGNLKFYRLLKSKTPKDNIEMHGTIKKTPKDDLITGSICSFCGAEGWKLTKCKLRRRTEFSEILFAKSAARMYTPIPKRGGRILVRNKN